MFIPTWMIFAILATIFSGLNNFFKKVSAHNGNSSNLVAFYFNFFSMIFSLVLLIVFFPGFIFDKLFWIMILIAAALNVANIRFKIFALGNIDTSVHFILVRFLVVMVLSVFGFILFTEVISLKEWIGIIIGFMVFFLLVDFKADSKFTKQQIVKGFLYTLGVVFCVSLLVIAKKYVLILEYDIYAYLFFVFTFSFFISMIISHSHFKAKTLFSNSDGVILFCFLQALFNFLGQVFSFYAMEVGKITIVAKVMSYSLFVPIILSMLVYNEKLTLKRGVALILTVVSLWFFI